MMTTVSDAANHYRRHIDYLCRFTGLDAQAMAAVLAELPDSDLRSYTSLIVAETWPQFASAASVNDFAAMNQPELKALLLRAYVASYCRVKALQPSQLADAALRLEPHCLPGVPGPLPSADVLLEKIMDSWL